ncbi:MAG: ATP-dependent Clp protease proteolytic subunit [Kovacikia sp.]
MRSLINTDNSKGSLLGVSFIVIGLLTLNPNVAVGQSARKAETHFKAADASKVATPDAHSDTETGFADWVIRERIVFISGEIKPELAETVISQLLYLDHQSPGKDIYLYINSPGGEVTAGLAIYDTIHSLQSNVVTVGLGEASSMASMLLASGTKGKRVALTSARVMIHQPWSGVEGPASDIAIEAKEILHNRSLLNHLLSELTGQPLKRIEADTDRNLYMSAKEAKAYGIVDKVTNQIPSASRPLKN